VLLLVAVLVVTVIVPVLGGEAAEQVSYNADIDVCMLVNCFCTVGGCAITGGEGDCDGNVCGCGGTGECEAAAWVSCNANIDVSMLVNCF